MEHYEVLYQNRPVGRVTVGQAPGGVRFDAVCTLEGEPVLRLCGGRDGKTLLIGVLAPQAGYWHIGRTVSFQTLRDAGFDRVLPDAFWLTDRPMQCPVTGDPLLDGALRAGTIEMTKTADGADFSCPFDCRAPSPLAFALTACTVRDGRAVLSLRGR